MLESREIKPIQYTLTDEEAYAYCQETNQLANGLRTGYMMLAQRLHKIKSQKLYQPIHEKWYMYCDEIGIREDLASKLTTIYEKFCRQFEIEFEEIKDVEYTKLHIIKPICETREMAEHWIEEAKELTARDLKKKVKELQLDADQVTCEHGSTYLVRCCRDCGETWEEYGEETKTVGKNAILDVLADIKQKVWEEKGDIAMVDRIERELTIELKLD